MSRTASRMTCVMIATLSSFALFGAGTITQVGTEIIVDVTEGATNFIEHCTGMTLGDVKAAMKNNTVTMFRKRGRGGLFVDQDFWGYAGAFAIEEGTYVFNHGRALGETDVSTCGAVTVSNGATLENRNGCNIGPYRYIYFEGVGVNGVGALVAQGNGGTYGTWGANLVMTGDALVADTSPGGGVKLVSGTSSDSASGFNMQGHKLSVRTRNADFLLQSDNKLRNPGDIELLGNTRLYIRGYRGVAEGSYGDKEIYVGPDSSVAFESIRNNPSGWTLKWNNTSQTNWEGYAAFGNAGVWDSAFVEETDTRRFWSGKVVLNTDMYVDTRTMNVNFTGEIKGHCGLKVCASPIAGQARTRGELHLKSANDFWGGIEVVSNKVYNYGPGVFPNYGGAFRLTDGELVFKTTKDLSLPDGCFSGNTRVTDGRGHWKSSLVKNGAGTLTYDSLVGAGLLEINRGSVVVNDGPVSGGDTSTLVSFGSLKAKKGTCLTYSCDYSRSFTNVTGFATVSGSDVGILKTWTVDCAELDDANAVFAVDGAVDFAAGTKLNLDNPDVSLTGDVAVTVMSASKGITGMPQLVVPVGTRRRWWLSKSQGGKSLVLTRNAGFMLFIR